MNASEALARSRPLQVLPEVTPHRATSPTTQQHPRLHLGVGGAVLGCLAFSTVSAASPAVSDPFEGGSTGGGLVQIVSGCQAPSGMVLSGSSTPGCS